MTAVMIIWQPSCWAARSCSSVGCTTSEPSPTSRRPPIGKAPSQQQKPRSAWLGLVVDVQREDLIAASRAAREPSSCQSLVEAKNARRPFDWAISEPADLPDEPDDWRVHVRHRGTECTPQPAGPEGGSRQAP